MYKMHNGLIMYLPGNLRTFYTFKNDFVLGGLLGMLDYFCGKKVGRFWPKAKIEVLGGLTFLNLPTSESDTVANLKLLKAYMSQ